MPDKITEPCQHRTISASPTWYYRARLDFVWSSLSPLSTIPANGSKMRYNEDGSPSMKLEDFKSSRSKLVIENGRWSDNLF